MSGLEKILEAGNLSSVAIITESEVNARINKIVNLFSPIKNEDLPFIIMALDKFLEAVKAAHPQEANIAKMLAEALNFETVYIERRNKDNE
jgi:hypothetical protein